MEAKIDLDGYLYIKRGKNWKKQFCAFTPGLDTCGDWCPLFGEPEHCRAWDVNSVPHHLYRLRLCHAVIEGTITDERVPG